MEPEQVEKRLQWLDEQHRKDVETLHALGERFGKLETDMQAQALLAQETSREVSRLAALSVRIQQVDEALGKHRSEVSRQLEEAENRRSDKERQIELLRRAEQSEESKNLAELRQGYQKLDSILELLAVRQDEEARLNRTQDALQKAMEALQAADTERARAMLSLDESRRQDGRRIGDLQTESTDLRMRLEATRGLQDAGEDRIRRAETKLSELAAGERERRESQSIWIESQNMRQVEFERSWKDWERRYAEFEKKATILDERMAAYEETYRALKQLREDMAATLERAMRQVGEAAELQRLSEDRQKQEWSAFQGDDQKRWNTYKLTFDEHWREHTRLHERLNAQVEALGEMAADMSSRLGEFQASSQEGILALFAALRDWAAELESQGRETKR
jgi:chromosome segregation ATPase